MATAQRLLGSGIPAQAAVNIVGDVTSGVTALGSSQATAYVMNSTGVEVTSAAGSTGVVLMPGTKGDMQWVYNGNSGNTITIYPPGTDTVNNGATSITLAVNKGMLFIKRSDTAWFSVLTA
jgi:hypothetical protein